MFRTAAVAILSFSLSSISVFAADGADRLIETAAEETSGAGTPLAGEVDWSMKPAHVGDGMKRPAALGGARG